ncbi:recombination associated protein RdgC [Povalibacter uvarum]|uniref:Recombination-associated protein RdgC n=1 Tax=Povalibacter uvarum TaxID=732238 RepID=A0A841HI43_9GAMM|nr:recombination-associated protein RdgC [Povalibacter uvarum]MBB6092667.1 recombination associated protein RdgC [Povalibacter uvarum]
MWFKNLIIYRLPEGWSIPTVELESRLSNRPLQAPNSFEMFSRGWVHSSPAQRYVHTTNGQHLIALGVEQKLLPSSIIKQVTNERAAELAEQQGFPVGRRQMRELKDRVTEELRARALSRRRITRAWIDPANGWFVVDAAGGARADELVETLRDTLGSLPVQFLETQLVPHASMGAWLSLGDAPLRFVIDQDLELQTADKTKATVRYVRHPLETKEIQAHLSSGKYPTRLGLTWSDRIAFVLTDKLQVKRVEFLEMVKEKSDDETVSPEEQFDIDFLLMTGELTQMLSDLREALGGEPQQEKKAA